MLRTLIIDDEAHIRDSLSKILAKRCTQVMVTGEAYDVRSGRSAIQELHPDLVLLDIQMPDGTGFDLLYSLPSIDFRIIFITAYDQYAIQAIKFSAVDYLLKPVNPEELEEAVNKAEQIVQKQFNLQMKALEENLKAVPRQRKKIILKTTENIHLVDLQDIVSCESADNYTIVHLQGGEQIMVSKTLKEYDELLSDCGFFRVHKSFLINVGHIKRFEKQDGGQIVLANDTKIPVASRKRDELLEMMERMVE
ncbi:MAG: LytTR family DNA-binding domain-containing protein [Bacteroidales bacterium]|nr:response regulator transcription factor [Lentimicrobiaceae bacterium]MDD5695128.1 LytTR family DNA-binding domain-containing protein [Bacteroidales bacterium]